jgi:hypothetical protein
MSGRGRIAAIPNHDCAAAILAFRNSAFEVAVVQRVVFDLDRKSLVMRVERGAFGDGPGFEDAIELKPQVIMKVRCGMFLNDKAGPNSIFDFGICARLRRFGEIPLGAVFCQQLFDHVRAVMIDPMERKVPGSVKVPFTGGSHGATCLLERLVEALVG